MNNKKVKSLSGKIVLSIAITSIFLTLVIFTIFEKMNKEAFYNIEIEKATIIADTIEPLIALNIYLDMNNKVKHIVLQLIENPNILAVTVNKGNAVINEIKSKEYAGNVDDSFTIEKTIFQPNSKKKMGTLTIVYSSEHYRHLISKYRKLTISILLTFSVLFLLFTLYIKKLLSPLRIISSLLKDYSPNMTIHIPFSSQNNEIGLISSALNEMQLNITDYSEKQKNINRYLEETVNKKTLELRKQLYSNPLTGLPNRLSLLNDINNIADGALIIINIDDFKEINDFYGNLVGDNILVSFSHKLKIMFKDNPEVELKHLSGDEFALLFMDSPSVQYLTEISNKLVTDIEKMIFYHEHNELAIRVTIGGTFQIDGAIEKADIALKSAKKQKKSFLLYDEKLNIEKQYKDNMEWVKKLKKAIIEDKIVPYYQPIYDNVSNKIISYECLIRLIDDNDNIVGPFEFLTISSKSRLYNTLTRIMVRKSCQNFEHVDCDFSINLSVEDMINPEIVDDIKKQIKKYNVENKVVFEILESEGIENYEEVSQFIHEMKELGCRIAIDDFGSGYSNFEHLLQLNVDYIKIDGTLIKNLDTDKNAQVVVQTIVDFAKRLNILTVAEYVHNETVFKKVNELNIDRSQGFFLAKPKESII